MHPLIETHREQIAALCRKYGVRRLEVFGSILRDDFDADSSDVDVVVEFAPRPAGGGFRQYFDLKSKLENLFGRPVDLVELHAMESMRLKRLIERSMVPVYAAPA
jgi:predicted nucleotidyltransferase